MREASEARPGEVRMKQFLTEQAIAHHLSNTAIWNRVYKGRYPNLKLRRVNKRVVFCSVKPSL